MFYQRMGRSKTHLADLCSPSTPLFFMPVLEEVGSVVDYSGDSGLSLHSRRASDYCATWCGSES